MDTFALNVLKQQKFTESTRGESYMLATNPKLRRRTHGEIIVLEFGDFKMEFEKALWDRRYKKMFRKHYKVE